MDEFIFLCPEIQRYEDDAAFCYSIVGLYILITINLQDGYPIAIFYSQTSQGIS
jgi:hypothetical protein